LEELQLHHHPKTIRKAKQSGFSLSLSLKQLLFSSKRPQSKKKTRKEAPNLTSLTHFTNHRARTSTAENEIQTRKKFHKHAESKPESFKP
jgi:hypothetical protein